MTAARRQLWARSSRHRAAPNVGNSQQDRERLLQAQVDPVEGRSRENPPPIQRVAGLQCRRNTEQQETLWNDPATSGWRTRLPTEGQTSASVSEGGRRSVKA